MTLFLWLLLVAAIVGIVFLGGYTLHLRENAIRLGTDVLAQPIRVEFANAVDRLTGRDKERKGIFRNAADRRCFLETLDEAVKRFGLLFHAYWLMPNDYHLGVHAWWSNVPALDSKQTRASG